MSCSTTSSKRRRIHRRHHTKVATSFLQRAQRRLKSSKEKVPQPGGTTKGIIAGKFKTPPPMTTPVEKRNANKFCEFHGEVGHNTDECNHLRKQIEDMLKAGKLSHIIRELKQNSGKEQPKKKGRYKSFSPDLEISFPPLGNEEGAKGPLIIEAEGWRAQVHTHRVLTEGHL
ncbi:hypothetical protein Tco_0281008 [Tanacetum coccineum]